MSKLSRAKGRRHKNGRAKEAFHAASSEYFLSYQARSRRQIDVKSPRDYQGKGYGK